MIEDLAVQPEPSSRDAGPVGLGGWLVLVALGLFITPLRVGAILQTDLLPIFTEGYWPLLTSPSSDAYHPLWAPLLIFETAGNFAVVAASIVALVLFFPVGHCGY